MVFAFDSETVDSNLFLHNIQDHVRNVTFNSF